MSLWWTESLFPSGIIPTLSGVKHITPYLEATIMEVYRYASVVPLGVEHEAKETTMLGPYTIAKGQPSFGFSHCLKSTLLITFSDSWVAPNLYFVHHNDEWWDEPEKFNPQRYLTDDNELKPSDFVIPFSLGQTWNPSIFSSRPPCPFITIWLVKKIFYDLVSQKDILNLLGKRRCLGEALAKAEIYILFAAVMQRFHVRLPEGVDTLDTRPLSNSTADTQPHKLRFIPR